MALTGREIEVLKLIAMGLTGREIAAKLSFSLATARKHRENLLDKCQVTKSTRLVIKYFAICGQAPKKS